MNIKTVNYNNPNFIKLCSLLEEEHVNVIKEQRSPKGNCLNNLDKFKVVFIAYDNNKAIGCVALKDKVNNTIELGRLYVMPEYRKKGVATLLFNYVFNYSKEKGCKRIILDTYRRFESAVSLYKRLGFTEIDNYIIDSPYSMCMEKVL